MTNTSNAYHLTNTYEELIIKSVVPMDCQDSEKPILSRNLVVLLRVIAVPRTP
jgi:hypothetical protein